MRDLICRKCGQKLSFENSLCLSCHSALGFHLPSRSLLVLPDRADHGAAEVDIDGTTWRTCANLHIARCNWLVNTTDAEELCSSCKLTRIRPADDDLDAADLDTTDAVLTTATVGIAETGTIVLDHGPGQGRRALTLVPDRHVCVVRADQVVPDVPDAMAPLGGSIAAGRPLTWISGPSATSDIELTRVEGVHGPRTLHVVLVE